MTLKGRNLLKMMDFTPEEILYLVDLSAELKRRNIRESCMTVWLEKILH